MSLTTWVFAILVVLALGAIAAVASGRGAPMTPEHGDRRDVPVPTDRRLRGSDLRQVRLPLALRGYRMAEVDALLDRLATELEDSAEAAEAADAVDSDERHVD